jgi:hypothetical protein
VCLGGNSHHRVLHETEPESFLGTPAHETDWQTIKVTAAATRGIRL